MLASSFSRAVLIFVLEETLNGGMVNPQNIVLVSNKQNLVLIHKKEFFSQDEQSPSNSFVSKTFTCNLSFNKHIYNT